MRYGLLVRSMPVGLRFISDSEANPLHVFPDDLDVLRWLEL